MIKFLEGFDSYGAGSFASASKWDNSNTVTLGTGRFSGFAAYLDNVTTLQKTITPVSGLTVGFSIIIPSGGAFLDILDGTAATALTLSLQTISSLLAVTSSTTAYSDFPVPQNTWVYLEISIQDFSSTAAGNIVVRLNGDEIFSSPLGFVITGDGQGSGIQLFGFVNPIGYDDLYICDNLGDYNTGFIEDGEILTLLPNGAGDETDFSVTGAATNWEAVSESPFDGDTSYVFSQVFGDQDLYTIDTMATGVTFVIPGIMVNTVARLDNTGSRWFQALVKSGANLGNGPTTTVTSTYLNYQTVYEREPVTEDPWNETLINGLQIGQEVL